MTKFQIKEMMQARKGFTPTRAEVKYSHTDPQEGDQWMIICNQCMGNGYDIDLDDVSMCHACDGMGESSPISEHQVCEYMSYDSDFPF